MRIILLTLLCVFLLSYSSIAQNNRFGIKTGIAISNITGQESEIENISIDWGGRSSLQTGVFYNIRIPETILSFQMEMDYKITGTSFSIADVDPSFDQAIRANYNFEYLGFSLLPRIDLFPDKKLNPNFMFGLLAEYRINSDFFYSSSSQSDSTFTRNDFFGGEINHLTNKFLFGYAMAGGVEINMKPVIITIEARYSALITPIFKESVEDLPLNPNTFLLKFMEDSRSQYASILAGFNFYF